ncbi:MAG TPA: substrate-binding domain-containing protein [Bauldia sp.]|nr:substrate-binding domain-containing protein [Bauldia sp.]
MKGIRRVAQHLDISIGTVSRALNGRRDVSESTRQRVLEAAAELGYVPNQSGRALRQGTTKSIGFMMQTGRDINSEGDSFFMGVFDGVQAVLRRHGLDLVVLPCSSEEDPDAFLHRVVARGFVDGLIISATRRHDHRIEYLSQQHIPFIALGRSLSDAGHPWFDLDFEGMAETAIDRLTAKGHTRIGIFAPQSDVNLGYVFTGQYEKSLTSRDIAYDPALVFRVPPNEAGGYAIARQVAAMPNRPTAIILINQVMSIGLYRGLLEAGLWPGRDIAVIGQDSQHAHYLSPRLTCFRLSLRDLGIALAESLLAVMPAFKDHYLGGVVRRIWPMELVSGESDSFQLGG